MSLKRFAADYLTFSKKERIAVLTFGIVSIGIYLAPQFYPKSSGVAVQQDTVLSKQLDSALLLAKTKTGAASDEPTVESFRYEVSKKLDNAPAALFYFDPNTLDAEGWKKLGLRDRTAQTILNYRSKGGHFYKPEDVQKIWGLPEGFYERVKDYIQIASTKKEYTTNTNFFKTPYEKTEHKTALVDVNTADTSAFIALPGIGSKLAQRIITFREKLGGFYSIDQIGETYGLPDSTFQKLKPYLQVHGTFKKLNVNTATKDELKTHPYIRWNLANAIVEYRSQHGPFKKLDELKNIMLIDDAAFNKIAPYVSIE